MRFPPFSYVMNLLGLASLGLRLRCINVRHLCGSGEYDAISKTLSRSERPVQLLPAESLTLIFGCVP